MPSFNISVDLDRLIPPGAPFTRDSFPALSHAVRQIGAAAHADWTAYASGRPLPSGQVIQNRTGEYARSILFREEGDFRVEVYSDLAYARVIEEGAPAYDQKRLLSSSLKVRRTKDGRRYLIIPFRWNSPGSVLGHSMPEALADWWSQGRTASSIRGTFERLSGTGAFDRHTRQLITVPGRTYSWGARLGKSDLAGLGIHGREAKRLQGMVNFRKPGATGGSSHSQLITFRTMVEGSKGWIRPAQPGKHPARTVADQLRPVAEEMFRAAIEHDVRRLLGGS